MEMADEKTWCWFIIGEKERAERQREMGEGLRLLYKWGWMFVYLLNRRLHNNLHLCTHTPGRVSDRDRGLSFSFCLVSLFPVVCN